MHKLLIIIVLIVPFVAIAQDAAAPAPVSPIRQAIADARTAAEEGHAEMAVGELQKAFDAGFTSVGFIMNDPTLSGLAGHADFDRLIDEMSRQAYPCEYDPQFREFDFWIGKWEVHAAGGQLAGHNEITREERGCVLIENWASAYGGGGGSINYVDKITGEWVQVWNDASGSQINIRGGMTEEGMLLEGTIHTVGNGVTKPFRGLWTPLPDGRVRQYFEHSDDDGETWISWFEGFYSRQEDPE